MGEYELNSLAYESLAVLQTEETTFLTILFGYLLAAHFLGARVPKAQLIVFNAMYVVTISGLVFNMSMQLLDMYSWVYKARAVASDHSILDGGAGYYPVGRPACRQSWGKYYAPSRF